VQRVAVFDFDRTLSTKHVGVFDLNSSSTINGHANDEVSEKVFGGPARVSMLHHMCGTLESAGVNVHVVSRNSAYVVKKALASVGLTYIQSVIGDDELQMNPHRLEPKSAIIRKRLLGDPDGAVGEPGGPHLLFVDDDLSNVKDVRASIPGATVIHVKEKGMGPRDVEAVYTWLDETEGAQSSEGAQYDQALSQQIAEAAAEPISPLLAPQPPR